MSASENKNLLDPGFELTLRPMRYPDFYERYRDAIKNTWTVEEVDLHSDVADLAKLSPGEQHIGLHRLAQLRVVAEGLDVAACAARYQTPSTGPIIGQPLPSLSRW